MHVIRRRGWEIPERLATPEHLFFNRRALLAATGAAALSLSLSPRTALAQRVADLPDPTKDLYPAKRNEKYSLDRPITDEKINTNYNNFYEFGPTKTIAKAAQALKLRPWTVKIDGMVEKAQEIGIDDLMRKMPLEERLYRHRCVEAWSMAIAWSGFPLAKLVEMAKPLASAKYVRMETFLDPAVAPGRFCCRSRRWRGKLRLGAELPLAPLKRWL
jgi:methionine sulfoxide reductase catalytic subunit